jgi:hypothetical protein
MRKEKYLAMLQIHSLGSQKLEHLYSMQRSIKLRTNFRNMSTKLKTAVDQKIEIRDYIFFTPKPHHPKRVLPEAQSEEISQKNSITPTN